MPARPAEPAREEPRSPLTKEEKEVRVARLKLNFADDSWVASKQRFAAGAVPLDENGNAIHGLTAEWTTSDKQVVFVTKDGRAIAGRPGTARLIARAGSKQESVKINVYDDGRTTRPATAGSKRYSKREVLLARKQKRQALFAHSPSPIPPDDRLPDSETDTLYEPRNDVGKPEGRTEAAAQTAAAANGARETVGSANYTFGVPLAGLPGRQLDTALALTYNSRVWHKVTRTPTKVYFDVDAGWPAPGFRLGYGQVESQGTAGFTLTEPDGTRREMLSIGASKYRTTDGSIITFEGSQYGGTVTYPDGTQVLYAASSGPRSFPYRVIDRHGNYISITYVGGIGPQIASIQDTLGRFMQFHYAGEDLIAITAPGYNGGPDRQVARFYYETITFQPYSLFHISYVQVTNPTSARILRYVYLPGTQNGYRYDYSPYGMIYKTSQLRGMTVSPSPPLLTSMGSVTADGDVAATSQYNYPTGMVNLTDVPKYTNRTDDWAGRTTASAATWSFSADETTGTSTVTSPTPDNTVTETLTDPATGQVLSVTVKYQTTILAKTVFTWQASTVGQRLDKIETTNEAQQTRATDFTYDTATIFNNVTIVSERDFAPAGTLGTELRRVQTTYENSTNYTNRGLIHLPKTVKVYPGGSATASSHSAYTYDGDTLTDRVGISNYDPSYNPYSPEEEICDWVWNGHYDEWVCNWYPVYDPATAYRGNVTSVTSYANAGAGTGARSDTSSYDIAGNVIEQTVNCCRKKTYGYSGTYEFAYVTSETKGETGQLSTSATYDFNTGLLRTAVSENNRTTTIHYDPASLRTSQILSPVGPSTYASTTFTFYDELINDPDTTHKHSYVLTTTQRNSTNTISSYQYLDGRGAVARAFSSYTATQGWVTQDVEYDRVGRVTRSSQPYYSTGAAAPINPSGLWNTNVYDKLSRVTSSHVALR